MIEVKLYKCAYCTKLLKTRTGMEKHEHECRHNPESQSCFTCERFVKKAGVDDEPHCLDDYDMYYIVRDAVYKYDALHRTRYCDHYSKRNDNATGFIQYSTGLGGYRLVEKESE